MGCPSLVARMTYPSWWTYDRQLSISDYLKIYRRHLPHQSEIDRMASNNATRQIFVEKRIVKELTIKFWRNAIWNTQTETLTSHDWPQDPRRVYKELSQETSPHTAPANSPEFKVPLPPVRRKIREDSRHQYFLASGCSGYISGSTRAHQAPSYLQRDLPQEFLAVPGIFLYPVKDYYLSNARCEINIPSLPQSNEYFSRINAVKSCV